MISLFFKECKNICKSLVYIIFLAAVVLFYLIQYHGETEGGVKNQRAFEHRWSPYTMEMPKELDGITLEEHIEKYKKSPYGSKYAEVPKKVEQNVFSDLYEQYSLGTYKIFPFGVLQEKKLNNDDTKKVEQFLEEISGKTIGELKEISSNEEEYKKLLDSIDIDYSRFKELSNKLSDVIGKRSCCDTSTFKISANVPLTYEEAVDDFNEFIYSDGISERLAIIFSDLMGLIMAIFPVFVAVYVFLKDRKSKAHEIIYSSRSSSAKLIICRYLAVVVMCYLPILILSIVATISLLNIVPSDLVQYYDYFAFTKFTLGFILPSIMIVSAVGMLLSLLTNGICGIVVQMVWFFYSMFSGLAKSMLYGNYGLSIMMIRLNVQSSEIYNKYFNEILINRIFYVGLSIALVIASCMVFELKRRGKFSSDGWFRKFFKFNQGKRKNLA